MKQVMFALGAGVLLFASCKKENLELNLPEEHQQTVYEQPMKVGSNWVYQHFSIDSSGVEVALNQYDSLSIIGDSVYNGNTYAVFQITYNGGNQGIYLQRDSSGYIVDEHGNVSFSYVDFTTQYNVGSDPGYWDYYRINLNNSYSISVPAGNFQTRASELYIYSQNGSPINSCGDMNYSFKTYYASGVGMVLKEFAYYGEFNSECKKREQRLIQYFIPE